MKSSKSSIGISLGFNSSAAACNERGQIIRAISEERLIREKNTKRIPVCALQYIFQFLPDKDEPHTLVYSHYDELDKAYFTKYEPEFKYGDDFTPEQNLLQYCRVMTNIDFRSVQRVDHHTAHAYSVFPYYKVPSNALIITSDGYGDGISQTTRSVEHMNVPFERYDTKDSLALVYQFVTGALGLKMHQHEGKVTGLSARGNVKQAKMLLDSLYARFSKSMYRWEYKGSTFDELKTDIFSFCWDWLKLIPEDVKVSADNEKVTTLAMMVQYFVEQEMVRRLAPLKQDKRDLFLAGGLFANVKLNSLIASYTSFRSVNVAPPMGDEGTAIGAILSLSNYSCLKKGKFSNVFSGIDTSHYIKDSWLEKKFAKETHFTVFGNEKQLIKEMAKLLAGGCIVHYRAGISEFGPRALCHSTTFYQPSDPEGTKYLNRTLGRSEYMPYAPIILDKDVSKLFVRNKKLDKTNQYMTAILKAHESTIVQNHYAGAIHVDGTARPQILYDKKAFAYRLLKEYTKLTGKLMLINTSWNIHNNPTVATIDDSFRTWMESGYCGEALVHERTMFRKRYEKVDE